MRSRPRVTGCVILASLFVTQSGPAAPTIYWTDPSNGRIRRADLAGPTITTVVDAGGTHVGIALDGANRRLYWADFNAGVRAANLDGGCSTLLAEDALGAHGITVAGGYVYIATLFGAVFRASISGAGVEEIVPSEEATSSAVAVDVERGKIYWTVYSAVGNASVRRADLDGSNVETVSTAGSPQNLGIALDLVNDKVYWADLEGPIRRADLDGANVEEVVPDAFALGLLIDSDEGKLYWGNGGPNGELWRADLDGSNPELVLAGEGVHWPALWPGPEAPTGAVNMSRTLALETPTSATSRAIRVKLTSLHNTDPTDAGNNACPPRPKSLPDLSAFNGTYRWVGAVDEYPENNPAAPTLVAASLQCCPHFDSWDAATLASRFGGTSGIAGDPDLSLLYLYGNEVVPCSTYELQFIDEGCPVEDEGCYSDPVVLRTSQWGDVTRPFDAIPGGTQPGFIDIGATVLAFRSFIPDCTYPRKPQAMLRGDPASHTSFFDIGLAVGGFERRHYKEAAPVACPPCE